MLKILLTHRVEKDVKYLPVEILEKVKNALHILTEEPLKGLRHAQTLSLPKGEALLGKYKGLRRYRIGDFRIVYEVNLKAKCITIIKIKHRKEVYR